jgi:glycosyltransferase involved in cell wall biosynthesis
MEDEVKPLVSVIIPARNAGPWIHDCLASLIAQDYENWEAIVVENGSTDNTKDKIKEFTDQRIKAESIESIGTSRARNRGFAKSIGEIILFLDADDMLHATALSRLCIGLEQNPDAAGVIGSCVGMSESGARLSSIPVQRCPAPSDQLLTFLTNNYINNGGQLAIRRSAIIRTMKKFRRVKILSFGRVYWPPAISLFWIRELRFFFSVSAETAPFEHLLSIPNMPATVLRQYFLTL